ncbi:protein lifeguard 1 [Penaeus vannamei]|uniref:protein lifeguard 1 n=1 Tax=Penaeus vannamei TaxID=6689 RepID=UPI00387F3BD9
MYSVSADRSPATFRGESIRLSFFGRVLTVLAPQLLVTFGLAAMFVRVSSFSAYADRNPGTFGFSLGVMCAMMLALVHSGNLRKKSPDKYIVLLVVAICEAYMLGDMSYCKEALDVTIALTMVVLMGLSVLASWVKYDFTMLAIFVVFRMAVPQLIFIPIVIWSNAMINMKYITLWAVLFVFCLLIDMQRIKGWKHRSALPPDELLVAFHLHLDLIHVSMYILAILDGTMIIG